MAAHLPVRPVVIPYMARARGHQSRGAPDTRTRDSLGVHQQYLGDNV